MKRAAIVCFIVAGIGILLLLFGCASAATVARMDGFNSQWRGYDAVKGTPAKHTATVTVQVVVGDNVGYPGAVGTYSHPHGIIRIKGKTVGGKIIVCEAVLGHEVLHALQFQDGNFVNPDTLTENGL